MRRSALSLLIFAAVLAAAAPARGGTYTVLACDAAPGGASGSWVRQPGSIETYKTCPTSGNARHGMATRATGRTFGRGDYSRLWFYAPPGTTVAGLHWSGRFKRANCAWTTELRAIGRSQRILRGQEAGGGSCTLGAEPGRSQYLRAPARTTALLQNTQCGAASCAPGAAMHTYHAAVVVRDPRPPGVFDLSGGLASGRWVRRDQGVGFVARDNVGISAAALSVGGRPGGSQRASCDMARAKPGDDLVGSLAFSTDQLPDGVHALRLSVTDCAGNPGYANAMAKVDNTPPARVAPEVVGGDGWRRSNAFAVRWSNRGDGFAPIARAHYLLCLPGGGCASGTRDGANIEELGGLSVTEPGDHQLVVTVEDEAGNVAALSDPVHLRFDPDPPELSFDAPDANDPLRVSVTVVDGASGVAGGELELRRRDGRTWHPLETTVEGSQLVAYVDDERFRRGSYQFRARAFDQAGNERSTDRRADGAQAGVELPVRFATRLRVGVRRARVSRRVIRRGGRRRVVRRRTVRYIGRSRVRVGRRVRLRGVLTNPDGQPIDGATIDVYGRPRYGARPLTPIGRAVTDARGRFSYIARARFSRLLRFRYQGTPTIKSANDEFVMSVPARSTIRVSRRHVRNGGHVRFRGRLRGGRVSREGKLTFLQAVVRGRWRTFATPRANRRGRWTYRYRFGATSGVVRYRFRLCVPRDASYPFDFGCSRATTVTVRGP